MNRKILWTATGALLLTSAAALWLFPAEPDTGPHTPAGFAETQSTHNPHAGTRPEVIVRSTDSIPPMPRELKGLEPNGRLTMDDVRNLVPTKDLRVLFDFYLANLDKEPLPRALQRIRDALGQRLVEPALGQSLALLERYVSYRMALDELDRQLPPGVTADGFDLTALRQRQQALEALRLSQFSPEEYSAFFDDEQRLDNYTLARLEIERSGTLSSADKQQQLTSLEQQLPEAQRQARKRATVNGEIYARAETLKAEGASKEELYQVRVNALGAVAAANLAQLDEKQRQWQARLKHYAEARARITEAGLSPADRDAEVEALRERLFSGREQVRVRALEVDGL